MDLWTDCVLFVGDAALQWLLPLPRGVGIAILAMLTGVLGVALRRLCTNRQCEQILRADLRQLRFLISQARAEGATRAVARHQANLGRVARRRFFSELRVLIVTVLPIAALATWCAQRLATLPLSPNTAVRLRYLTPPEDVGAIVHLLPVPGIETEQGWLQRVAWTDDGQAFGSVEWILKIDVNRPIALTIRHGNHSAVHRIAARWWAPRHATHRTGYSTTLLLGEYRPFGYALHLGSYEFPGWLMVYLPLSLGIYVLLDRFPVARRTSAAAE